MKLSHKILSVAVFNGILVTGVVTAGYNKNDIYFYFQEKEAVTFLSALLLGLTSLCAFILSFIMQRMSSANNGRHFWRISAAGFFYLSMDEYFMMHEGMDTPLIKMLGCDPNLFSLDGYIFAILGVAGLIIAWKCWQEIILRKDFIVLCVLATVCLFGMVALDILHLNDSKVKVIEETFKIAGVTFFFAAYFSALLTQITRTLPQPPK